jgi:enoyl-CoA hydratase/carnithine racemase
MPGAGGTQLLPRRIGVGPAKELLLLGGVITATEAHRVHLINRVVAAGGALAEAHAIATRLAGLSSVAVQAIKRSLDGPDPALACGLDRERALFMEVFASHDANEGVQAFVEKRPPTFAHR